MSGVADQLDKKKPDVKFQSWKCNKILIIISIEKSRAERKVRSIWKYTSLNLSENLLRHAHQHRKKKRLIKLIRKWISLEIFFSHFCFPWTKAQVSRVSYAQLWLHIAYKERVNAIKRMKCHDPDNATIEIQNWNFNWLLKSNITEFVKT